MPLPNEVRPITTRAAEASLQRAPRSSAGLRLLLPLGLAPTVALVADCNLVIGAGDYRTTCGEFAFAALGCEPCMQGACCAEAEACRASALCAPLFDCLSACGAEDVACHAQCYLGNREIDAVATAMIACQETECTAPCLACGNQGLGQTQACADCGFANCCAQETACARDATCQSGTLLGLCADPACTLLNQAALEAFNASPLIESINQCVTQNCSATCTPAHQSPWACTGRYSFTQGPTKAVQFSIFVTDTSNAGLDGVKIQACNGNDVMCDPIVAEASPASPAGLYLLTVPNGFDGYLLSTLAGNAPILQYLGFPVTDTLLSATAGPGIEALVAYAMLPTASFDQYLGLSGITGAQDTQTAAISVNLLDCYFAPAAGVAFAGAPGSAAIPFYFTADNTPATNLTATQANGRGGLVVPNVTAGQLTTITGKVVASAQIVAERTVVILPGALTEIAYFVPLTQ